ncbi:hypothetical protein HMPREF1342_00923 [Enterococcus faecalis ERV85]|uniref:Uncharacterized protein n=1 Tax=Enterococcus faecalis ERV63 TaxID=1134793 RepID=A0AAV3GRK0_ENTFL|nr:hypothetical protein HMPREF1336_00089 [Enterococcus faecalis ERV63]EJV25035.1 hypothetical protein HMPREF1340_02572 [Enterococcus faecalis ERV73]EJV36568.1 hypothetical protein HMPREF1342_00923 [Enterococcus faecalis ERV85]
MIHLFFSSFLSRKEYLAPLNKNQFLQKKRTAFYRCPLYRWIKVTKETSFK